METRNNILNRIFTRDMLRHLIAGEIDNTYSAVVRRYVSDPENKKNREIISEIYNELKNNYRNEYYYKNTLLNKLLVGIHSVNTSTALTEIPVAGSKADFIMINGKAVVYEIKTELDNMDRLRSQIHDYYKAFDHVAVVTGENHVSAIIKMISEIEMPVGIYVLKRNGKVTTLIEPEKYEICIDKSIMFKILRKREYENIIVDKYGFLPNVSQFKYYRECEDMFCNMNTVESYNAMIKELKKRSDIRKEEFIKIPYELRFLRYFVKMTDDEVRNLGMFLEKRYGGV